jgi:cysteinyl-tRNA synthetase
MAELHGLDKRGDHAGLKAALALMGFDENRAGELSADVDAEADMKDTARIDDLIAARLAARKAKNFAESDRIRDELAAMGIQLKDDKDPATGEPMTTWEVMR